LSVLFQMLWSAGSLVEIKQAQMRMRVKQLLKYISNCFKIKSWLRQ